MSNPLDSLKQVVHELEFASKLRIALTSVRLIHESDQETFDRILRIALKVICKNCRGYGHTMFSDTCADCKGTGNLTETR